MAKFKAGDLVRIDLPVDGLYVIKIIEIHEAHYLAQVIKPVKENRASIVDMTLVDGFGKIAEAGLEVLYGQGE